MNRSKSVLLGLVITFLLIIANIPDATSAEHCEEWIAEVISVQGSVQARVKDGSQWVPVQMSTKFCAGDMIRVQEKGRAGIALINETIIRLDQNTTLTFTGIEQKKKSLLDLIKGIVHFISRVPRTLTVSTPFVNGTVEGTEFLISALKDHSIITVFEGNVMAMNQEGSLALTSGQSTIAREGQAPVPHIVVRPRDAVQWALYYPPIIYYGTTAFSSGSDTGWQAAVKKSIQHYWDGDLTNAISDIAEVKDKIPDHRFYTYRASLLLTVGRVEEARSDIDQALKIQPDNSDAVSLQSVIAVVQNEKEKALSLAEKAVESDPDSAAARIAHSYAQQAHFNLKEALTSLQEAVKLEPENSLAWARLSELWLSFKELDKALVAAKKAVELNPHIARTQTVLGFAYLTQVKTRQSMSAFEKAIGLDQAAPLPRLGLGLAKIRRGDLKEGRKEIEIAASLDPGNSLIRSYLGKAYYEEKRDRLASDQFTMSQELDPLDPTPLFYDAIRKQSINRPVEALHDLQKAIELNDNRAIYRSKLLLDEDLAARSASLARIYNDLNFRQLALVEGWTSLSTDPGSYSAHRFLADSYSVLPRHEVARVSELLQSQLLQPINITPVQPQLAESSLFILGGTGPGDLSFNEFNPMFNRDRVTLHASVIVGDNGIRGDELVISAVKGKASISAGQFHYESDGFRDNNDLEQDVYNVFTQVRLSHKTSILAEFRSTETEQGDLTLLFDPEDFSSTLRNNQKTESIRGGLRYTLSPNSEIIATFIYKDSDEKGRVETITSGSVGPFPATIATTANIPLDDDGYMAEIQHLFNASRLNVISGAGYFKGDRKLATNIDVLISCAFAPLCPITTMRYSVDDTDIKHTNLYIYSHVMFPRNMTWTIGGSAEIIEGGLVDQTHMDPKLKLGLTWNPFPKTTFRAAFFKVLKRTLISSQTLEPTQVAGFNQFYDDGEGTESKRYGVAIDQKFSADLNGGVEFSERDLDAATLDTRVSKVIYTKRKEQLGRAYLYWTPHNLLAVSTEYQYERFERDPVSVGIEQIVVVETHSLPLQISLYHPSGLFANIKTTYVDQQGKFGLPRQGTDINDSEQFWVTDASIGFRFPKRHGIITIGARNLFNDSFNYQDMDFNNPTIYPERLIFTKFTLAF